jgi:hypothetical protein
MSLVSEVVTNYVVKNSEQLMKNYIHFYIVMSMQARSLLWGPAADIISLIILKKNRYIVTSTGKSATKR